jgi:sec-independent protein translocase protein TatA
MTALAVTPPGGWELIVILLIFVLLFGAKKLPELGSSVGKSIKNFKRGIDEGQEEAGEEAETSSSPASRETE